MMGMEQQRAEIREIASSALPPDFENTIAALENSGRALSRVLAIYHVYTSTMSSEEMQETEREMAPVLAAFDDEIVLNAQLFARVRLVHQSRECAGLTAEERRLVEVVHRRFARHGAELDDTGKRELAAINRDLAALYTRFSQNELADEEGRWLMLDSEENLAGLPEFFRQSAAAAATEKGLGGKWLIANTRSAMEPFLTHAQDRELRERAFRLWTSRGDNGDQHDNNATISEILSLRARKARLLGFPTFAHWVTDDQMAKRPEAAMELMSKVWAPAVRRVREDIAAMQQFADAENGGFKIAPWDYRFYAEKIRKQRYDIDESEIKPYLQLDRIRDAAFWAARALYGLEFHQVQDVPTCMPDVLTFEVTRMGKQVGFFYLDAFARTGKQSGAWMSEYRQQERFRGEVIPIVSCNMNFMKAGPGETVLISWDEALTIFHEFGHALHALNSSVAYPSLSGTNVARDFVEFPSQLFERWLPTDSVLTSFATHHRTGEPMPTALSDKIRTASTFNQGFATVEYLASALVDMKVHLAAGADTPRVNERETLLEIGMPDEVAMRHRMPHFGHIFAGEGYAAGYYNYIWADTLVADAAEAFREAPGGFYDVSLARRLHDEIMSAGDTVEAAVAFRRFRGREASVDALMRERGFPTTTGA